ncbi:hypothetical protein [Absidia glauca]|uniref:Xylanolytic transcriptional activator regulatory domain-containing protein n=1 Tax=Absidia glauca TaxID=4829 RepID=A0A163TJG2_ABSGL|nr:hypothetical protein [Absidia glauca]
MPFDTVEHSHKRLRYDGAWEDPDASGYQFAPSSHIWDPQPPFHLMHSTSSSLLDMDDWKLNPFYNMDSPARPRKISTPSQFSSSPVSDHDFLASPTLVTSSTTPIAQQEDEEDASHTNQHLGRVHQVLNKCCVSYTSTGLNVEAKVTNATELRSLIDAFSKLCPSSSPAATTEDATTTPPSSSITLYRNKLHKSKPVNFFASVYNLNHMASNPTSTRLSLRQIGDACIDTYFSCWVRNSPIIDKTEFMTWYTSHPDPMDTLIVNAICSLVFGHTAIHHTTPGLELFKHDQDLVLQQKDLFFERSRTYLELSFDTPDRWTVIALLFMSCIAEPDRRHHYSGMATSALLELDIYPRMVDDEEDDDDENAFKKEMDTRLWWFAWSIDFYLYSAGVPKNTPQTKRKGQVDLPRICEQDIDEAEHGVLADIHCLKWWRFQSDVIADVYEQDTMTAEQLRQYDDELLQMYQALPDYLQLDSGFVYGCEDLFTVCVRVNIEFNATRIILHMPFLPDATDLQPTPIALQSLNVCLKTALIQLRTISACNQDGRRCAFDRDELWRAGELISLSMDVYRNCQSPEDRIILLQNIAMEDYKSGLHQALAIMQASSEFKMARKDWVQVSDWLQNEIGRHEQLDTLAHPSLSPLDGFLPIKNEPSSSATLLSFPTTPATNTTSKKTARSSSSTRTPPLVISTSLPATTPSLSSSTSSSSSTEFITFCPEEKKHPSATSTKKQPPQRQAARFRYFNPRTMNKFLFIDDHPLL